MFLRTRQVRWDLSSRLVNGKKYHDCFLPFNPIIIITCCGVHNQRKRNLAYHIYRSLTIASKHSNGGTCKCVFFAINFSFFFLSSSLVLNFAFFKLSRNSQNKSHANIKCFTV